jgi:hypothetical protein
MVQHRGYVYKYFQNSGSVIIFEKEMNEMRNKVVYRNGKISWK